MLNDALPEGVYLGREPGAGGVLPGGEPAGPAQAEPAVPHPSRLPAQELQALSAGVHLRDQVSADKVF